MNIILFILIIAVLLILLWALYGTREFNEELSSAKTQSLSDRKPYQTDEEIEPEKAFRRRAGDRDIEETLAEENKPARRKEDSISDLNRMLKEDVQLPYPADSIISDTSRFRIYKKTLRNAEIYAEKGDIYTAVSLFEGVRSRINDEKTLNMIDEDINYLKNLAEKKSKSQKDQDSPSVHTIRKPEAGGGLRFTIDGPIPESLNIGVLDPDRGLNSERIAEKISGEIKNEILHLRNSIESIRQSGTQPAGGAAPDIKTDLSDLKAGMKQLSDEKNKALEELEKLKNGYSPEDLSDLKQNIERLSQAAAEAENQAQQKESLEELEDIRRTLNDLQKNSGNMKDLEELINGDRGIKSIKKDLEEISNLKNEMQSLNQRLDDFKNSETMNQRPSPVFFENRNQDPIPITIDPKPFADLINSIPGMIPKEEPSRSSLKEETAPSPLQPEKEKLTEKEKIHDEEEDESFELLSEFGKDKDEDDLSDDDIFEKILKDSTDRKGKDEFEVLGDSQNEEISDNDIYDSEQESKRRDNENFYKKLLNTDRRKKRELPILKVSYDFKKLPDEFSLSKEQNILEYSFYKYKPMLEKAAELIKTRRVREAINYYKVIMNQNIPPEMKSMVRKNINDLNEYLEKYLASD